MTISQMLKYYPLLTFASLSSSANESQVSVIFSREAQAAEQKYVEANATHGSPQATSFNRHLISSKWSEVRTKSSASQAIYITRQRNNSADSNENVNNRFLNTVRMKATQWYTRANASQYFSQSADEYWVHWLSDVFSVYPGDLSRPAPDIHQTNHHKHKSGTVANRRANELLYLRRAVSEGERTDHDSIPCCLRVCRCNYSRLIWSTRKWFGNSA